MSTQVSTLAGGVMVKYSLKAGRREMCTGLGNEYGAVGIHSRVKEINMRIEHVAMYCNDLERAKKFFSDYFGAKSNEIYHNKKTDFRSYFLTFDDGARLEIMNRPDAKEREKKLAQTGFIHVAFSAGSKEKVDELTKRLKGDGYSVISGPRTTGDGYYESCILDYEGNQIEITV